MTYATKWGEEAIWGAVVAGVTFILTVLATFDPETITDWRAWAIALGAGTVRAIAGALLPEPKND